MIRGDWRWAHKRSIIPPSDRRRYRPTRWSKSTKGEQTQRHNRSVNGHNGLFLTILHVQNDGGGQKVLLSLWFHLILTRRLESEIRWNSIVRNSSFVFQVYENTENWMMCDNSINYVQILTKKIYIRQKWLVTPTLTFRETLSCPTKIESDMILIIRDKN